MGSEMCIRDRSQVIPQVLRGNGVPLLPVKLQGLDAKKMYKVKEINLMPNSKSNLAANENTYSGDYLMKVGIHAFTTNQAFSRVIELTAE